MLLKQRIRSPFKAESISFAQVMFFAWIFLLIRCNILSIFADTMNWKSSDRRSLKYVYAHRDSINFMAIPTSFFKKKSLS